MIQNPKSGWSCGFTLVEVLVASASKVNMNYQLLPFTYIERSTGLHAILKSEKVAVIPNANVSNYKTGAPDSIFRLDVNIPETLSQFTAKFSSGEILKSASEICDIHIVPSDGTAAGMPTYWRSRQLTGDNMRKRIYTTIYPRLTTKSITYMVHYKVQALKNWPGIRLFGMKTRWLANFVVLQA